jgi:adenylosuccinate synthase
MVVNSYGTFHLHLVPSGIFNPEAQAVVGTGTVINCETLLQEMQELERAGVGLDNLLLSERAQLIMPYHRLLDGLEEAARAGCARIGTTKRGVGPAYTHKAARCGLRLGDLLRPDYLRTRIEGVLPRVNRALEPFGQPQVELDELHARARQWGRRLQPHICDTLPLIHRAIQRGDPVLLEGQLGVMRDLDWGIYPFVTSSTPLAGGACAGAGIPPTALKDVVGVVKAYSTAVGAGPFPVELLDADGERLRSVGKEFGTTTGRPRRCGWFDGVAIDHARMLNGFSGIAVTKLDVLDGFERLRICSAYELDGERLQRVPDTPDLERVTPVYEEWPGWQQPTGEVRRWDQLPAAARAYLERIAELAGAPIRLVSVGPERDQIIVLEKEQAGA